METKFIHKISKGSRFNQIYIPREMDNSFKVGDTVEITLLDKKLFFSSNLRLGSFKEELIKRIFSSFSEFKEIERAFIFGSFLTNKVDYNDIDILVVSNKDISEKVFDFLIEKFNLKFHVISISLQNIEKLLRIDPLIRSMLFSYVSTEELHMPKKELDKNHIKFLLMMPEDILEIKTSGKVYYDSIRRLLAIERFLENKDENPQQISESIKKLLGENILSHLKNNEPLEGATLDQISKIINEKLKRINNLLK